LAIVLPAGVMAADCNVEIQPPLLAPAARDGHQDRAIYGWQLMTHEERADLLARLQEARTPAERAALRQRNHLAMLARARERGVILPPEPGTTPPDGAASAPPMRVRRDCRGSEQ
jgi:hypothetical protein